MIGLSDNLSTTGKDANMVTGDHERAGLEEEIFRA
jgi:hypothetical protein